MKVLIVQCNMLIKDKAFADLKKSITEEYKKTGIVFLPCGFSYEIVEVDDVASIGEVKPNPEHGCFDCVYEDVLGTSFPCCDCGYNFRHFKSKISTTKV